MRIIGGAKRGLVLQTPKGDTTRPTMDRAREDIMNIVQNGAYKSYLQNGTVADVFAGSGSVGLEMVSRGANHCDFYEIDKKSCAVLKSNIDKFQGKNCTSVYADALRPAKTLYNIVFMDAPYYKDLSQQAVDRILKNGNVNAHTLWIIQIHISESLPEITGFTLDKEKKIAGGRVGFYVYGQI